MKTCFFIGHRDAPEWVDAALALAVERHIVEYGVTEFIVGHYGNFDRLAAAAVIAAKRAYPQITLTLLLPYHPTVHPIETPCGFDGTCYPINMENVPPRFAIPRANRYAVEQAEHLIAYVVNAASNAREVMKYAEKCGVTVENLASDR